MYITPETVHLSSMLDPELCGDNEWVDLSVAGFVSVIKDTNPVAMVKIKTVFIDENNQITTNFTQNTAKVLVPSTLSDQKLFPSVLQAFNGSMIPIYLGSYSPEVPEQYLNLWKRFYSLQPCASMPDEEGGDKVIYLFKRAIVRKALASATLKALGEIYGGIR